MRGTGGSAETLGVDSKSLGKLGNDLMLAADDIPPPPAPFVTTGSDPISTSIKGKQADLETPIQTGLPQVKTDAKKTGGAIAAAALKYEQTDEQLAQQIKQHTFEDPVSSPSGGGLGGAQGVRPFTQHFRETSGGEPPAMSPPNAPASGAPAGGAPAGGAPASSGAASGGAAAGAAGAGAAGAGTAGAAARTATPGAEAAGSAAGASSGADAMGQMGQLISMPMQMAGQAIGALASIPQSIMQGVESAVQQVSQVTEGLGQGGDSASAADKTELMADHKSDESPTRPDEQPKAEQAHEDAAPGQPHGERAPDAQPQGTTGGGPAASPPVEKPPAQTRPADSADRMQR